MQTNNHRDGGRLPLNRLLLPAIAFVVCWSLLITLNGIIFQWYSTLHESRSRVRAVPVVARDVDDGIQPFSDDRLHHRHFPYHNGSIPAEDVDLLEVLQPPEIYRKRVTPKLTVSQIALLQSFRALRRPNTGNIILVVIAVQSRFVHDATEVFLKWKESCAAAPVDCVITISVPRNMHKVYIDVIPMVARDYVVIYEAQSRTSDGVVPLLVKGAEFGADYFSRHGIRPTHLVTSTVQFIPREVSFISTLWKHFVHLDKRIGDVMLGCSLLINMPHSKETFIVEQGGDFLYGNGLIGTHLYSQYVVRRHQGLETTDERFHGGHFSARTINTTTRAVDVRHFPEGTQAADFSSPYCSLMPLSMIRLVNGTPRVSRSVIEELEVEFDDGGSEVPEALLDILHIRLRAADDLRIRLRFDQIMQGDHAFRRQGGDHIQFMEETVGLFEVESSIPWVEASRKPPTDAILAKLPPKIRAVEQRHASMLSNSSLTISHRLRLSEIWLRNAVDAVTNHAVLGKSSLSPRAVEEEAWWDFCLTARRRVIVAISSASLVLQYPYHAAPSAVSKVAARFINGHLFPTSNMVSDPFKAKWGRQLNTWVSSAFSLEPKIQVYWFTVCCHCCGFSQEIESLVYPLQSRVNVHLGAAPDCFCPNSSRTVADTLSRLHVPAASFRRENPDDIVVWISHTDPSLFHLVRDLGVQPDYLIGRSMYEFSRIRDSHITEANRLADEIWVPAETIKHFYISSGADPKRIVIVPEAIDTHLFNPGSVTPAAFPSPNHHYWCNKNFSESAFRFFSDFKWEPRKGWEILYEAYFRSFLQPDAPEAVLYLLTHIWFSGGPETYGWAYNITYIVLEIEKALAHTDLFKHRTVEDMPAFCIISQEFSTKEVVELYASADAFVYTTRGEGWGLPAIQAMSMALPVIASRCAGCLEFLKPTNSYLIQLDGMEELAPNSVYGWGFGKKWCIPSMAETGRLMLHVAKNPDEAKEVGRIAREYVVKHFSMEALGVILEQNILRVRRRVLEMRARGEKPYFAVAKEQQPL